MAMLFNFASTRTYMSEGQTAKRVQRLKLIKVNNWITLDAFKRDNIRGEDFASISLIEDSNLICNKRLFGKLRVLFRISERYAE